MTADSSQQTKQGTRRKKAATAANAVRPESVVAAAVDHTKAANAPVPEGDTTVTEVEATEAVEGTTDKATTNTVASEAAVPSATPADPFDYDQAIITLSFSFLPVKPDEEGNTTARTVIVSAHSKSGEGKSVLPEFIAPLSEADLALPATVRTLLERYRTVILPQRKAVAAAKAAALATKRPVASTRNKDARPEHIVTNKAGKRGEGSAVAKTQLKFNFSKAN